MVKLRVKAFLEGLCQRMAADHPCDGEAAADPGTLGLPAGPADDSTHGLAPHALVVSHGAYMRLAVRYLVEDLKCIVPRGMKASHIFSACPNTGICRFVLTVHHTDAARLPPVAIHCVFINRKDHLKSLKEQP
ncbi:fructose-2,6-bisphosphatase TIGAR [Arapaima gigas]